MMILFLVLSIFQVQANYFDSKQLLWDMTAPLRNYMRNLRVQAPYEVRENVVDIMGPNYLQTGRHLRIEYIYRPEFQTLFMSRNGNEIFTTHYQSDESNVVTRANDLLNFRFEMPVNYHQLEIDYIHLGIKISCYKNQQIESCTYNIGENNYQVYYLLENTEYFTKKMLWYTCNDCDGNPAYIYTDKKTGQVNYFIDKSGSEVTPGEFSRIIQYYIGPLRSSFANKFNEVLKKENLPIFN